MHRAPYPPNRGDRIRSFHLLKFLATQGEVHLAFLCEEEPDAEAMTALGQYAVRVTGIPYGGRLRWVRGAWSLATGGTATEGLFRSLRLRRTVQSWARSVRFDAVVVFCSSMVQYLDVEGLAGVPVLVDLVDVDSQKFFDYAQKAHGPKRWLLSLEGRRLRRLETGLADRAAAMVLSSERETELYRSLCRALPVHGIANGVDLDYFQPEMRRDQGSVKCVFVGALDYTANVDGLDWFCREAWPGVRRRCPHATLAIVGSNPGPAVRKIARTDGVELVGSVPDVRPYLAAAAVVVVPLRIARGIQNKVLEALAMGRAVVASSASLEGLEVDVGIHLERADEPGEWIATIGSLLEHPETRQCLGRAGRKLVEDRYRWDARLKPLEKILESLYGK